MPAVARCFIYQCVTRIMIRQLNCDIDNGQAVVRLWRSYLLSYCSTELCENKSPISPVCGEGLDLVATLPLFTRALASCYAFLV